MIWDFAPKLRDLRPVWCWIVQPGSLTQNFCFKKSIFLKSLRATTHLQNTYDDPSSKMDAKELSLAARLTFQLLLQSR